jgi:hypothetical protein
VIIQVRGTSGSGKSTVVSKVMQAIGDWDKVYVPPRKRPICYLHYREVAAKPILVLGHYEIACGGCDTIGSVPQVFAAMQSLVAWDYEHIICEGLLLSEDVKWSLPYKDNLKAIFLTTPVDECLRRVTKRQEEKGREPADPARVVRKLTTRVGTIERARLRLVAAGADCRRVNSDQAVKVVLGFLGYTLDQRTKRWTKSKAGSQLRQ